MASFQPPLAVCYHEVAMAQQEASLPAPVPQSPAPRVPWGIADIAMALGLLIVAAIVTFVPAATVAAIIAGGPEKVADDPEALAVVLGANLVLDAALIGVAVLFSVGKYRCSLRDLGFRLPSKGGLWFPVGVLVAAYLLIGVYFGIVAATGLEVLEPQSTIPEKALESRIVLPIVAVLALVFAPVMEETFFRGFVFGALRSRWGALWAALASGLLFAALHFNLGSIIPFTLIGMLFAGAYAYSGSLFASVAAHFLFNVISFLVSLAQR